MLPQLARRKFKVEEYELMGRAGILGEDEHVELIEGEIVEMTPIGSPHAGCVNRTTALLISKLSGKAVITVQNPVWLDDFSEPEPDFAILRWRPDYYATSHPRPGDVLFLIEVADSSLHTDKRVKAPLYARAGIPETWIVDVDGGRLEVLREPSAEGYAEARSHGRGESIEALAFPGIALAVEDMLGPELPPKEEP